MGRIMSLILLFILVDSAIVVGYVVSPSLLVNTNSGPVVGVTLPCTRHGLGSGPLCANAWLGVPFGGR
jgi:hypothetical protein